MTDTGNSPTGAPHAAPDQRRCGRRRGPKIALVALFAIGAGFCAGNAMSHGFGPLGHHFGPHGAVTRVFAPATADEASDRAARLARHLAVEVDASAEQETKLKSIARTVAKDVYPLREQMQQARKKGLELMRQPTVDRAAVEALRAEQMARIDDISRRLSTALADAGEVLSPDQRTKLVGRIEAWRERFGWWKRLRSE